MHYQKERGHRHRVRLDATVTREGGHAVQVIVTDLSIDGCCLIGMFRIGERVTVEIPRVGKLDAEIRWSFMGRAGARFTRHAGPGAA